MGCGAGYLSHSRDMTPSKRGAENTENHQEATLKNSAPCLFGESNHDGPTIGASLQSNSVQHRITKLTSPTEVGRMNETSVASISISGREGSIHRAIIVIRWMDPVHRTYLMVTTNLLLMSVNRQILWCVFGVRTSPICGRIDSSSKTSGLADSMAVGRVFSELLSGNSLLTGKNTEKILQFSLRVLADTSVSK